MVVQVQKSGDTFSFKLSVEEARSLAIQDGSTVEIKPAPEDVAVRYVTREEGLKAYNETRLEFDEVYRELAK